RRLQATKMTTLEMLEKIAAKYQLEVLPAIRTDPAVQRQTRGKAFLADHDPRSKALNDYAAAAGRLVEIMNVNTPIAAIARAQNKPRKKRSAEVVTFEDLLAAHETERGPGQLPPEGVVLIGVDLELQRRITERMGLPALYRSPAS